MVPKFWWAVLLLLFCLQFVRPTDWGREAEDDMMRPLNEPMSIDDAISLAGHPRSKRSTEGGPEEEDFIEGMDMVVNREQYNRLRNGVRGRDAKSVVAKPWKDGIIPYIINTTDFTPDQIAWIKRAMRNWEAVTCIKFVEAKPGDLNNVTINGMADGGCWAHLGQQGSDDPSGKKVNQGMNLDKTGCFWKGLAEHELGHVLGLIHEHQRPQRDRYIRVDYFAAKQNMVEEALMKYAEGSDDKMGLEYDLTSVMHYGKTAFTANGHQVFYPVDSKMSDVIGLTLRPSFIDAKLINLMYQCKDRCPQNRQKKCREPCFLTAECTCFCPNDIVKENCVDKDPECPALVERGGCLNHYYKTHDKCRKSCGICDPTNDPTFVPKLPCINFSDTRCKKYVAAGRCTKDSLFMMRNCPLACGECSKNVDYEAEARCEDKAGNCPEKAAQGECARNVQVMLKNCRKSCKFCLEDIHKPKDPDACEDFDDVCSLWAGGNICERDYVWMRLNCPKACGSCDFRAPRGCVDKQPYCRDWKKMGHCTVSSVLKRCRVSCNNCDGVDPPPGYSPDMCKDWHYFCKEWAEQEECGTTEYMNETCKESCHQCPYQQNLPTTKAPCVDSNANCATWAQRGECSKNEKFMKWKCKVSCGVCTETTSPKPEPFVCRDLHSNCRALAGYGDCLTNTAWMLDNCPMACQMCNRDGSFKPPPAECADNHPHCVEFARAGQCHVGKFQDWMSQHCKTSCNFCWAKCEDRNRQCSEKARRGECESNPKKMHKQCPLSCNRCIPSTTTPAPPVICRDLNEECASKARRGDCQRNPEDMNRLCPKSCRQCTIPESEDCKDLLPVCLFRAETGFCEVNPEFARNCSIACGICIPPGGDRCEDLDRNCPARAKNGECKTESADILQRCRKSCHLCISPESPSCKDEAGRKSCGGGALRGMCEDNVSFAESNCRRSCNYC